MLRKVVTDRKVLAIPTEQVITQEEVTEIVRDLEEAFVPLTNRGFGLAANQIGINKAVALLVVGGKHTILVNPKIIEKTDKVIFPESCFSFSGITVLTDRYNHIKIENGFNKEVLDFVGIAAIAVQHEIAHLQGKTLFDFKHKAR